MIEKRTIDISTGIIFRTILILLGIWFLYVIRDIVAILFIAIIITSAIEPMVNWINDKKIPRSLAVLIIYVALFLIIGTVIYFLIPPLISQTKDFAQNFPLYADKVTNIFQGVKNYSQSYNLAINGQEIIQNISNGLSKSSSAIFSTTVGLFSGFISVVIVMSLTFYMSMKKDGMKNFVIAVTPENYQDYAVSAIERIKIKIGRWMQGQLFLMLTIFALDFMVLYFLNIPYALILAIIGGLLEIIPYIGPIISAVIPIMLGFMISPITGMLVAIFYIVIHQLEGHVIVPNVMKKAVGLNPIVVILVLLIGAKLDGAVGAILSVPVATAVSVFVDDLVEKKEKNQ
jgi:predicted PurR-regulated permease PerM